MAAKQEAPEVRRIREQADKAWARGHRKEAERLHNEARRKQEGIDYRKSRGEE